MSQNSSSPNVIPDAIPDALQPLDGPHTPRRNRTANATQPASGFDDHLQTPRQHARATTGERSSPDTHLTPTGPRPARLQSATEPPDSPTDSQTSDVLAGSQGPVPIALDIPYDLRTGEQTEDTHPGQSTPVTVTASSRALHHKKAEFTKIVNREMTEYVAQLTVSEFLDTFLPGKDFHRTAEIPGIQKALKAGILEAQKESDYYAPLCKAFNAVLTSGSNYTVKDTADRIEDGFADHKPDLTMFHKKLGNHAWEVDRPEGRPKSERWHKARVGFAWSICLMEIKTSAAQDPFVEADGKIAYSTSEEGQKTRAQIFRYAVELFLRQHREFLFIVLIIGRNARLTLWDHTGVVTTKLFNYVDDGRRLFDFIHRLAKADRAGQGFDTTVRPAEPDQIAELENFNKNPTQNPFVRRFVEEMLQDQELYPINQLTCEVLANRPDGAWAKPFEGEQLTLLIGKYRVRSYSPTGRATKGYFAYAVGKDRLLFLKDSWRPDTDEVTTEVERYAELYKHGVPNIAKLVAGSDTRHVAPGCTEVLRTRTHELIGSDIPKLRARIQTRLVFETLGIPLEEYQTPLALIMVIRDALKAHQAAWVNAKILHRDISAGNILIDIFSNSMDEPRGILIDWDLSKHESQLKSRTQHARSGTWAFMSGATLRYPLKPPYVCDDLESFIHLVNFLVLRFHRTTLTNKATWGLPPGSLFFNERLAKFVENYFYDDIKEGNYSYGGDHKFSVYEKSTPPFKLLWANTALARLLTRLHELCHLHYKSLNEDTLEKYSGREEPAPEELPPKQIKQGEHNALPSATADVFSTPHISVDYVPEANLSIKDPLAKHDEIITAFEHAVSEDSWLSEKTPVDQFLNLPGFDAVYDKRNSVTRSSASGVDASTGPKRDRDPEYQPDAQRKSKRSKSGSGTGSIGGSSTGSGSRTTRTGLRSAKSRQGSKSGGAQ